MKGNAIVQHDNAQAFLSRQQTMFRLAERDYGITRKLVCLSTGYSRTAIDEWARGDKAMSGPAIHAVASMPEFPADLLSLLFDGTNRHVADDCETGDLDALVCETAGFTSDYVLANSDGHIDEVEGGKLQARARRLMLVASAASPLEADRAMRERFVGKPYAKRRAAAKRGLA